jgi:general nucleoside transport system permease protein
MDRLFAVDLLAAAVRIAAPLALGALGGLISERAGVFAVGIEGMMLAGAFGAAVGTYVTGSWALGLLLAILAGAIISSLVAVAVTRFRADQMVTGLAVNILSYGLTSFLLRGLFGGTAPTIHLDTFQSLAIPGLSRIPLLGKVIFQQPPLTYLAILIAIAISAITYRTRAGLLLRAAGENPEAVFAAGNDANRVRQLAVVCGGGIAGLGGAVLVLQDVGTFTDGMTGGRGFLALAALIVGRWTPFGAIAACLMFGLASALEVRLQGLGLAVSSYVIQMVPYVLALVVLAVLGRSARMPQAIGRPYRAN